jgi:4'-phosphopantetheinyl transferase
MAGRIQCRQRHARGEGACYLRVAERAAAGKRKGDDLQGRGHRPAPGADLRRPNLQSSPSTPTIWIASLARSGAAADRLAALLTQEEQARGARLRNDIDRRRFTIGRALTRLAVAAERGCDAQEVAITVDAAGKPWLAPAPPPTSLSIAHGGDLVAVALAGHGALGVDVESRSQTIDLDGVLPIVCGAAELDAIRSLPVAARLQRFLLFWTLKEAFLKATGTGLGGAAQQVVFDLTDESSPVLVAAPGDDGGASSGAAWRFMLAPDLNGHVLALAFRIGDGHDIGSAPVLRDAGDLLDASPWSAQ